LCVFFSCSCYKLDMEHLGDISSIFLSFVNEDPNDSISLLLSELLTMWATFFPTKADVSSWRESLEKVSAIKSFSHVSIMYM
jgi:hypothetical protein